MASLIGFGKTVMHNPDLVKDYITRAGHRLKALQVLFDCESYADVVREAQEAIELCLKALLRHHNVEAPRIHDVSQALLENEASFAEAVIPHIKKLAKISKSLRRDRELAYYGSEDLTPSDFYQKEEGEEALANAVWVHKVCAAEID